MKGEKVKCFTDQFQSSHLLHNSRPTVVGISKNDCLDQSFLFNSNLSGVKKRPWGVRTRLLYINPSTPWAS